MTKTIYTVDDGRDTWDITKTQVAEAYARSDEHTVTARTE